MFDDLVASVFLSLAATDVDSIGDVIMGVDDTVVDVVVVTIASVGDPHFTLKFPFFPS